MRIFCFLCLTLLSFSPIFAQKNLRIDPPFWWNEMPFAELELIVSGKGIGAFTQVEIDGEGAEILLAQPAENPDYLYVTLELQEGASPGMRELTFSNGKKKITASWEIRQNEPFPGANTGLTPADLIYLILPDRFANGNPENDIVKGTQQASVNRDSMFWRHGGDLQGIQNHLDYIQELGATALWLNPVQENDQPFESYHGYAITDHYKIDPRLGDNEQFRQFSEECHNRGLKLVMDVIYNHVGNEHYLIKNPPGKDWVHEWDVFTRTTYRAPTLLDPYASEADKTVFQNGWFDHHMPDLDQRNPHLANYLLQNTLWWIKFAGIDALRIDTYAYPDQNFMKQLCQSVRAAFPEVTIFGETWVHGTPVQAWFVNQNPALQGVTDFQLYYALNEALNGNFGWTDGASRLYYTLAKDYLYEAPANNVIFLDNHDLSRFYSVVGEDLEKYKSGIALLLTLRGIPMLYYGTEILMKNFADPDGKVREDFPGGWPGDPADKFSPAGRNAQEQEAFAYVARLANWRKRNAAVQSGKLMQFVPEKGVYVYFRYTAKQTVMVVYNSNNAPVTVETARYAERMQGFRKAKSVTDGKVLTDLGKLNLERKQCLILEFTE